MGLRLQGGPSARGGGVSEDDLAAAVQRLQDALDAGIHSVFVHDGEPLYRTLPDPDAADAPPVLRLVATEHQALGKTPATRASIGFVAGDYALTTGTADRASMVIAKQDAVYGFAQHGLGQHTPLGGRTVDDFGAPSHNPLSVIGALYEEPGESANHYKVHCWLKESWYNGQLQRLFGTTLIGFTPTVRIHYADGTTRSRAVALQGNSHTYSGIAWRHFEDTESAASLLTATYTANADDEAMRTVGVSFSLSGRKPGTVPVITEDPVWLGGSTKGWTWLDPASLPLPGNVLAWHDIATLSPTSDQTTAFELVLLSAPRAALRAVLQRDPPPSELRILMQAGSAEEWNEVQFPGPSVALAAATGYKAAGAMMVPGSGIWGVEIVSPSATGRNVLKLTPVGAGPNISSTTTLKLQYREGS